MQSAERRAIFTDKVVTEQCRGTRAEAEVRGAGDNVRTVVGEKKRQTVSGAVKEQQIWQFSFFQLLQKSKSY